jgi:hypothetical protein
VRRRSRIAKVGSAKAWITRPSAYRIDEADGVPAYWTTFPLLPGAGECLLREILGLAGVTGDRYRIRSERSYSSSTNGSNARVCSGDIG